MWNQKITRIGNITGVEVNYLKFNNQLKKIKDYQGYIHNFNVKIIYCLLEFFL